jgi:hypothetical protein
MAYSKDELEEFTKTIHERRFSAYLRIIERKQGLVLEAPYKYSHGLTQGKWSNLKGLRSAPILGGDMNMILAICEDCMKNGHTKSNIKYCGLHCRHEAEKRVIFIAFGQHDEAYGRL